MRAICSLDYNAHTNTYFKELKILKLNDIYKINLGAIMFSHIADPLNYTMSNRFTRNSQFHNYNTRNRDDFTIPHYSRAASQACFLYQASIAWNEVPPNIKDSHSVGAFRKKYKKHILELY